MDALAEVDDYISSTLHETDEHFVNRFIEYISIAVEAQVPEYTGIFEEVLTYFNQQLAYRFYKNSHSIPYINTVKRKVEYQTFNLESLSKSKCSELWKIIGQVPLIDLHCWNFENNEFPLLRYSKQVTNIFDYDDAACFGNISSDDEIEVLEKTIADLFEECVANKYWTIPPKAFCDIRVGEFDGIELNELNDIVYFKLTLTSGYYLHGFVDPTNKNYWFAPVIDHARVTDHQKLKLVLLVVITALIRDFWVVETREQVFGIKSTANRRIRRNDRQSQRIIYLPRAKYINTLKTSALTTELNLSKRRSHFVRAHVRKIKCKKSSEAARTLAEKYGLAIFANQTVVKSRERGDQAKKRYIVVALHHN